MSYTILETTETHRPLVAVYEMKAGLEYVAAPVLGWATYRDYSNKETENLLVPITFAELNSYQAHYERSRSDVVYRLPQHVLVDEVLFNELMDLNLESNDPIIVIRDPRTSRWTVAL